MKKLFLSVSVIALLVACGSGEKKKEAPKSDSTKTDTTATTNTDTQPKVKDYAYYVSQFKAFKLDGVQLSQFNFYQDTANKVVNIIYRVNNAAEVGYDEVILNAGTCNLLIGESRKQCDDFTLESFTASINEGAKKKDILTTAEYKSGETSFYYATRKNIKGTMGSKDFNQIIIQGKIGEFLLDGRVDVFDLKSDMVKAEDGMKKVADYLAQ